MSPTARTRKPHLDNPFAPGFGPHGLTGTVDDVSRPTRPWYSSPSRRALSDALTGEWVITHTSAKQRRVIHYWLTILWVTLGLAMLMVLRDSLWFVGLMSLFAIWATTSDFHLAHADALVDLAEVLTLAGNPSVAPALVRKAIGFCAN